MANIQFGPLVKGATGALGSVTFGKATSGWFVKRTGRPSRAFRTLTAAQARRLGWAASKWRTLTKTARDDWAVYALTLDLIDYWGTIYHPTPMAAFVRNNTVEAAPWTTSYLTAPTLPGVPATHALTLDYAAGTLRLTAVTDALVAGERLWLTVMRPTISSIRAGRGRQLSRQLVTSATGLPYALADVYRGTIPAATQALARVWATLIDADDRVSTSWPTLLDFTTA